jgi:hypothetical protein
MWCTAFVIIILAGLRPCEAILQPWDLPVFPNQSEGTIKLTHGKFERNTTTPAGMGDKRIPRLLWIAVRDAKDKQPANLNYQMLPLFNRNPLWEVHIAGTFLVLREVTTSKAMMTNIRDLSEMQGRFIRIAEPPRDRSLTQSFSIPNRQ